MVSVIFGLRTRLTELKGVDVRQLRSITVSTPYQLLLIIVKIASRQSERRSAQPILPGREAHKCPNTNSGIITPSVLCISTGIPCPLLYTEIWFFSRSMLTFNVSIVGSFIYSRQLYIHQKERNKGTNLVIGCIDQDFIEDLEETRNKGYIPAKIELEPERPPLGRTC
jgi:hypothetical protein